MIPGFFAAGARTSGGGSVNEDNFNADTTSLYTMTQDLGSPSAIIAGGELSLVIPQSAGAQASFTRNGTSIMDGWVEAVVDTAFDSGLLFRFQDQNNFYLLGLSDDSGAAPNDNLRLFRRVSGVFTLMMTHNANWPRGSERTIRLAMAGTSIVASINGSPVISLESAHIPSAGKIGVRGNGIPGADITDNRFNALRWS